MPKPLLLQLAVEQSEAGGAPPSRYNPMMDELQVLVDGRWQTAIDAPGPSPATKKKDIEKGEDTKDRW